MFIGVGQIPAGTDKDWGVTGLFGQGKDNPVASFNFTITTDKKGNFTGVKVGDQSYSTADWNKQFLNTKPQEEEEKKRRR